MTSPPNSMLQTGNDLLLAHVSPGALHNSNERCDSPRHHPRTRVELIANIKKWLNDVDDPQLVLWLKGSAGFGKSVIADAIASLCYQEHQLLGAFFVSGSALATSGRTDEMKLVATLAYQMARNIPFLSCHIAYAIERNPLIFDMDIATQIDELIIGPLSIRSDEMSTSITPMLILMDAVDEIPSKSAQARIVQAFSVATMHSRHHIPIKLFITSRPTRSILSALTIPQISPLVHTISLDDDYPASVDIRTFLVESFSILKRTHSYPEIFPLSWPADEAINEIIQRSSGQFLYAARVLASIEDEEVNPVHQLTISTTT